MKIHILVPDSITPVARYVERQRREPDSFTAQLDFAAVLLYREGEYRAMYGSRWVMGKQRPAPSADSPFQPYDITPEAAASLVALLEGQVKFDDRAAQIDDLFGLKESAADGLGRVLRPIKSHRAGWRVYARLLRDLGREAEFAAATEQAAALGEPAAKTRRDHEAADERIRQLGVRTRTRVEGAAFTRFLSTPLEFCRRERDAAQRRFSVARVPRELRALVPLAREIGVGDDPCRALFVSRMRARDRRAAAKTIREHRAAIDAWLSGLGGPPYSGEAAAFFWLLEAAEEMGS